MKYPIAVLTNDSKSTYFWLDSTRGIVSINYMDRTAQDVNGHSYKLIYNKEQACEGIYSDVIVSPFYESLLDFVRTRIRK